MFKINFEKLAELFTYDPQAPIIFSSGLFLFLFLGVIFIYYMLRNQRRARMLFVMAFSYYFYYKSSGMYFLVLAAVTIFDFVVAKKMFETQKQGARKILLVLSIVCNLGLLCYFKYTNFFYEIFCNLSARNFTSLHIFLPVGVSFFTFQSMSYTLDIYRKKIEPLKSFFDYAFFVSFFPQLVAGPIVRAKDFIPQINSAIFLTKEMFGRGIFLILTGLFKKAIISDYISINFVDRIFDNPTLYTGIENLLGIYGYALQIYCDFSGYSDMAIGIALLLGFHFNINFDSPYKSMDITEFWRRWHISLSTWLRDYLYISLGGNRKGKVRTYVNLIITMLLGGLWHGASLRFICWGALHGVALAIHKLLILVFPSMKHEGHVPIWRRIAGVLITFHLVCFGWIFFRSNTFHDAMACLSQIVYNFHFEVFWELLSTYSLVLGLMAFGFLLHFAPRKWELFFQNTVIKSPLLIQGTMLLVLIVVIIQIKSAEIQPFIYFQF